MTLAQELQRALAGLLCRTILHLSERELRAVVEAWPLLMTVVDEPKRAPRLRAIDAAYAEAQRIARGGAYNRQHPHAQRALLLLINSGAASINSAGKITMMARAYEALPRLDVQYQAEIAKCVLGVTDISAPKRPVTVESVSLEEYDELPPWTGGGADILVDATMSSEEGAEGEGEDGED